LLKNFIVSLKQLLFYPSHRKLRLIMAFVFYWSLIVLGMIPGMRAQAGEYASGAVLHSLAYSIITYLLFTGIISQTFRKALACLVLVAVMGALDEYIQSFFPYRSGSIRDWMVDMLAAACTLACLWVVWTPFQKALRLQDK
jgi:VanZ family protein